MRVRLSPLGRAGIVVALLGALFSFDGPAAQAGSPVIAWSNIAINDNALAPNLPFGGSNSVAVNAEGDIFYTNIYPNAVIEGVPSGSGYTWSALGGTFSGPGLVTVTGTGTVLVATADGLMAGTGTGTNFSLLAGSPTSIAGLAAGPGNDVFAVLHTGAIEKGVPSPTGSGYTWSTVVSSGNPAITSPAGLAVDSNGNLYITNQSSDTVYEGIPSGSTYSFTNITDGGELLQPYGVAVSNSGVLYVTNLNAGFLSVGLPSGAGYVWSSVPDPGTVTTSVALTPVGGLLVDHWNGPLYGSVQPTGPSLPSLANASVDVGGVQGQVVSNFGLNTSAAIQNGAAAGFVEERAALQAGASFNGEGMQSSYLSAILSGSGVGLQQHVSAVEQGQFAALYQKLGIIPTWTQNTTSISAGVTALIKAGASDLAIENYLVQLDGFAWSGAESQAQENFPIQFSN